VYFSKLSFFINLLEYREVLSIERGQVYQIFVSIERGSSLPGPRGTWGWWGALVRAGGGRRMEGERIRNWRMILELIWAQKWVGISGGIN